jgi:hypothetical protein
MLLWFGHIVLGLGQIHNAVLAVGRIMIGSTVVVVAIDTIGAVVVMVLLPQMIVVSRGEALMVSYETTV